MGFCFYNNVAVAIKTLRERYPYGPNAVKRVLILDWDVHHGNGTQRAFWDDPDTLYISLHRYENGEYYPGGTYGANDTVGPANHPAQGTTVNIGWPTIGMGDADYLHAFHEVVMPIAREFSPDFVVISAGFDAAEGDQYGECLVTPRGYAHMTHMLSSLATGRLAVVLEGGYNVQASAASALEVTKVIIGEDPPAYIKAPIAGVVSCDTVREVQKIQSQFWRCMRTSELANPLEVDGFADVPVVPRKRAKANPKVVGPAESDPPPILTPLYQATAAWRSAHLKRKFGLVRLPLPDSQGQGTGDPDDLTTSADACQGSVHISEDLLEKRYNTVVIFVHDAGTVRADPPGVAMVGPDVEAEDEDDDADDYDEIFSQIRAGGLDSLDQTDATADVLQADSAARRRYARAYAHLKSSREDWSSYLIDTTDSMLSWAVYEGRHGVIDVALPTHLSLTLHSGRQKDTYHGPVDPKLSRAGAHYLKRLQHKIDSLLLHVWDNCVRACPGSSGGSSSAEMSSQSSTLATNVQAARESRLTGPDVVLIGHGPGCAAVLRLISARALHLSQALVKVQASQSMPSLARPLPIVRAVVQIYGHEDLAMTPKATPAATAVNAVMPSAAIGQSPRGHPTASSTAALAASAQVSEPLAVATVAQYASQPGGVGLTIAAQRLGLPTTAVPGSFGEHGPYINPGTLPTTPGRPLNRPESNRESVQSGDDRDSKEKEEILLSINAGPELRKWYAANSKVILPRDHPYFRWKLEGKVRRSAGDISKRTNENDALKLLGYALPGIVSFIEGRVAAETTAGVSSTSGNGLLAEETHMPVVVGAGSALAAPRLPFSIGGLNGGAEGLFSTLASPLASSSSESALGTEVGALPGRWAERLPAQALLPTEDKTATTILGRREADHR